MARSACSVPLSPPHCYLSPWTRPGYLTPNLQLQEAAQESKCVCVCLCGVCVGGDDGVGVSVGGGGWHLVCYLGDQALWNLGHMCGSNLTSTPCNASLYYSQMSELSGACQTASPSRVLPEVLLV